MKKVPKVVVIGLDSATWTVIRPWMAEGSLPNLAKLMQTGVVHKVYNGVSNGFQLLLCGIELVEFFRLG